MVSILSAGKIIKRISQLLEINSADSKLIKSFQTLEIILNRKNDLLENFLKKNSLRSIGPVAREVLEEINQNIKPKLLKELETVTPLGLQQLLQIKGLGPKKIILLSKNHELDSPEKLLSSISDGSIFQIKGFAKKNVSVLDENIKFFLSSKNFFRLDIHEEILTEIIDQITLNNPLITIQATGESLTKAEVFEKIELIAVREQSNELIELLRNLNWKISDNKNDFIILKRDEITLVVNFETSNSDSFNSSINNLHNQSNLIKDSDLLGVIHTHSNYSDGINSISEMANEAIKLKYEYLVISDHSVSAIYANGLNFERIKQQHAEINSLNDQLVNFTVIKGMEVDILKDGTLDYEEDILKLFDVVISSVHSNFELDIDSMTSRIINALVNPYTHILAHPTGRLLLKRPGYKINYEKIFAEASKHLKIIELNSNPQRLDLSWKEIGLAKEMGIKFCISPDAHSVEQFKFINYGIMMARKAGLTKSDVINCLPKEELIKYLCSIRNQIQL